jgi:hypothetical protein
MPDEMAKAAKVALEKIQTEEGRRLHAEYSLYLGAMVLHAAR